MSVNGLGANWYYLLFQNSWLVLQANCFPFLHTADAHEQALRSNRANSLGELLLLARTFFSAFYVVKIAFLHCLFDVTLLH